MKAARITHFVPWDSPGRFKAQAVCGAFVDKRRDHATQPTCPECVRRRAEYEALNLDRPDPPAAAGGVR